MARRKGRSTFAALLAAEGTELEEAARDILTPIVLRLGSAARIGRHFGVCERSARRLLARYGWTQQQPASLVPFNCKRAA